MQPPAAALAAVLTVIPLVAAPARAQGPGREERVVDGTEAWREASRLGFEFHPVIPDDRYILAGPRDGAVTSLKACPASGRPCEPEAQVLDGEMTVLGCPDGCERAHEFRLFGGRPLAPGWRLRALEIDGDGWAWARPPRFDSDLPGLAVRLESRGGVAATARIRSIRLEGPAGADWRDAFAPPAGVGP